DVVAGEVLERAVRVALRDPGGVQARTGDRRGAADAGVRLLASLRGFHHPAGAAAEPAGLAAARVARDRLHRGAQFSGRPASISTRRRRGPSRYFFRSARLASQPMATSPWYLR